MKENFQKSLHYVLVHEGGYVDHPRDPGGATNKGITIRVFKQSYGDTMTKDDLRVISDSAVSHIYKRQYWDVCRCDELPSGVDYVVFDQAVNSGPRRSALWLQDVVGVNVDGAIGTVTIAAAKGMGGSELIDRLCDMRMGFLRSLRAWSTFGRGWTARVESVRVQGKAMAKERVESEEKEEVHDTEEAIARLRGEVERLRMLLSSLEESLKRHLIAGHAE